MRVRSPTGLAVLMEVAAWRERVAQSAERAALTRDEGRCDL